MSRLSSSQTSSPLLILLVSLACLFTPFSHAQDDCAFSAGSLPDDVPPVRYTFGDAIADTLFTGTVRVGDPPDSGYEAEVTISFCNNITADDSCVADDPDRFGGAFASIEQFDASISFCDGYLATWVAEDIVFDFLNPDNISEGVFMSFTGGQVNHCSGVVNTTVNLHCSEAGINDPPFTYAAHETDDGLCLYVIDFHTPEACKDNPQVDPPSAGSSALSGGWVFVIILVVAILVYLVVGVLYKSMQMGTSGIESIPNIDFWRSLPQLVREGCAYTRACLCGSSGGSYDDVTERGGSYNAAATSGGDVYNPIAGKEASRDQTF